MARELNTRFIENLESSSSSPILLFEAEFSSGTVRFWTGYGEIGFRNAQWVGSGELISVGEIKERSSLDVQGLSFLLAGLSSDIVSIFLNEVRQGLPGKLFVGFLRDTGELDGQPVEFFSGRLDITSITDEGSKVEFTLTYESKLRDIKRNVTFRYTPESQKALYPDDKGFDFVPGLQDKEIEWGN